MSDGYCMVCDGGVTRKEKEEQKVMEVMINANSNNTVCNDPSGNCGDCCDVFKDPTRRERFGITLTQAYCHCRDICIQEVRAMCAQDIDFTVNIPTAVGTQSCRGEFNPNQPPFTDCKVLVTCAQEQLKPNCSGTDITIGFQIILTCTNVIPPTTLVINVTKSFECVNFFAFPDGQAVNVPELLRIIDGSQLVIQDLSCQILDSGNPRVRVTGKLIDKLWKEENLWIQAIRPYSGITIKQEFAEPHKIGTCTVA